MSELSKYVNSRQFLYYLWSISNLYIALYVCTSYNCILIKLLVSKEVTTGTVYYYIYQSHSDRDQLLIWWWNKQLSGSVNC